MRVVAVAAMLSLVGLGPAQGEELLDLVERRGFCSAQSEKSARAKCFEDLSGRAIAELDKALKDAQQLKLAPPPSAAPQVVDQAKAAQARYEPAFRAFVALNAATETGVTYVQFGPLIQAAATEVALISASSNGELDAAIVAELSKAVDAYADSATWWEKDASFYSRDSNRLAYRGGLPFSMVGLESLVTKWAMPTQKSDIWGINEGVPRRAALATMWTAAEQAVGRARYALQQQAGKN